MPRRAACLLLLALCLFATPAARAAATGFMLGVDVFLAGYTDMVKGQRVGLLTNQTGRNGAGVPTVDLLHARRNVNLSVLFAPEHGIRGDIAAGAKVDDLVDAKTGLKVFSLYGRDGHAPTPAMLAQVDTIIYDIQDTGSRAYTFIWTLAETMKACGQHGVTVIVLDRPNPCGGLVVDGPIVEEKWRSFIGLYPIPRVYGLTVGELARYLNSEYKLNCRLVVIPMAGYHRNWTWANTGLTWVPTSPNVPSPEAAVGFAATGTIGTLGSMHIGLGTGAPFQIIGAGWMDAQASAAALNQWNLPGVKFIPWVFVPTTGGLAGQQVNAVYLQVTDAAHFLPCTTELVMLHHLTAAYPTHFHWPTAPSKDKDGKPTDLRDTFDKAMGTSSVRLGLASGKSVNEVRNLWGPDLQDYARKRARYLLYD